MAKGAPGTKTTVGPAPLLSGKAHRWQVLLEDGRYASISELTQAEEIDRGYLGRILLLTLLAPDIVEARAREPIILLLAACVVSRRID